MVKTFWANKLIGIFSRIKMSQKENLSLIQLPKGPESIFCASAFLLPGPTKCNLIDDKNNYAEPTIFN